MSAAVPHERRTCTSRAAEPSKIACRKTLADFSGPDRKTTLSPAHRLEPVRRTPTLHARFPCNRTTHLAPDPRHCSLGPPGVPGRFGFDIDFATGASRTSGGRGSGPRRRIADLTRAHRTFKGVIWFPWMESCPAKPPLTDPQSLAWTLMAAGYKLEGDLGTTRCRNRHRSRRVQSAERRRARFADGADRRPVRSRMPFQSQQRPACGCRIPRKLGTICRPAVTIWTLSRFSVAQAVLRGLSKSSSCLGQCRCAPFRNALSVSAS